MIDAEAAYDYGNPSITVFHSLIASDCCKDPEPKGITVLNKSPLLYDLRTQHENRNSRNYAYDDICIILEQRDIDIKDHIPHDSATASDCDSKDDDSKKIKTVPDAFDCTGRCEDHRSKEIEKINNAINHST